MSVQFTWAEAWRFLETTEQKDEVEQELVNCLSSLSITDQIKALKDCPIEVLRLFQNRLRKEVKRGIGVPEIEIDWSKLERM